MLFSSTIFIFLFLPVVLALYFVTPVKGRNLLLVFASLFFYAWGEGTYMIVMLFSMGFNYLFGMMIERFSKRAGLILGVAVIVNLTALAFFKYALFLTANLNALLLPLGIKLRELHSIHLPIGISFFTFHSISYLIDIYRKDAPAQKNPVNLALYISFFPQLIAGPIIRYHDIADQLTRRPIFPEDVAVGIRRFIVGLGKKVLIANTLAACADQIFSIPSSGLTAGLAWLGIICYTLQIYFDFSGYSDMAIGLARIFGFRFLENFNYPYISKSIQEFWRRWHISLSNWFRDYLYIPLGGNRGKPWRTYFNLVTVFFLCGLWHGASWNFVVWGLIHGAFLVLERVGLAKWLERMGTIAGRVYMLAVVMLAWVFFRTETPASALNYIAAMAGFGAGKGLEHNVAMYMNSEIVMTLCVGAVGAMPVVPYVSRKLQELRMSPAYRESPLLSSTLSAATILSLSLVFLASASYLAAGTYNPFIYFRF
ncbi:MAG: putative poly(beta-D-mannuronate) O-acetyltransferase [Herminiimonas sp.]|nr:putative poly(beta-D-mannuronate) O-acetyltransferase [Herminiimonas sp.]